MFLISNKKVSVYTVLVVALALLTASLLWAGTSYAQEEIREGEGAILTQTGEEMDLTAESEEMPLISPSTEEATDETATTEDTGTNNSLLMWSAIAIIAVVAVTFGAKYYKKK